MTWILPSLSLQFCPANWTLLLLGYQAGGPKCGEIKSCPTLEVGHGRHCRRTNKYRTWRGYSFRALLLQHCPAVIHHINSRCHNLVCQGGWEENRSNPSCLPPPPQPSPQPRMRFAPRLPWDISYYSLFQENQLRNHKLWLTRKVTAQAINTGISNLWVQASPKPILSSTPTSFSWSSPLMNREHVQDQNGTPGFSFCSLPARADLSSGGTIGLRHLSQTPSLVFLQSNHFFTVHKTYISSREKLGKYWKAQWGDKNP